MNEDYDSDGLVGLCDIDNDNDGNPDDTDPNLGSPIAEDDYVETTSGEPITYNVLDNDDFLANINPSNLGNIVITNLGTGSALGNVIIDNNTGEIT